MELTMQQVIEIRRDCPEQNGAKVHPESGIQYAVATFGSDEAKQLGAESAAANREAEQTFNGVADVLHTASGAEQEDAKMALRKAEVRARTADADLIDAAEAELQGMREAAKASRTETAERVLATLAEIERDLTAVASADRALSLVASGKGNGKMSMGRERIAGGDSLWNLMAGVRSLLPQPDMVYVSPAAMKRLRQGFDVEDKDGKPLSFEQADALFKAGRIRVNYGTLQGRG